MKLVGNLIIAPFLILLVLLGSIVIGTIISAFVYPMSQYQEMK